MANKIELAYSPVMDVFYCNDPRCCGSMEVERLGRRFLVLRCTVCGGAIDGRLVDFAGARKLRDAYHARIEAARVAAEKWAQVEAELAALRAEMVEVVEVSQPRRSWLAGLLGR